MRRQIRHILTKIKLIKIVDWFYQRYGLFNLNYSRKILIGQNSDEMRDFLHYLKKFNPLQSILEIGCFDGGTSLLWLKYTSANLIVSVDLNYPYQKNFLLAYAKKLNKRLIFVKGNSHSKNIIQKVSSIQSHYDLLFIDGGHSYSDCGQDFINYRNIGTRLAFHDINGGRNIAVDKVFFNSVVKYYPNCITFQKESLYQKGMGIGLVY